MSSGRHRYGNRRQLSAFGRLKKAVAKAEFEILFVIFAFIFYVLAKYSLYRFYEYMEENKIVFPDFKLLQREQ
jgi:hypothetical protein